MEIATRALKDQLSECLKRASAGEAMTITAHGKPVARLLPPEPNSRSRIVKNPLANLAWIRAGDGKKLSATPLAQMPKPRKKVQLSDLILQDRE